MNLFDPNRKRTNDMPELIGRRFVVPRLNIFPREDGTVTVSAMIPSNGAGRYSARQVLRTIPDSKLAEIVENYRNDPENTLETLFEINLSHVEEPSDFDFAKDLSRGYNEKLPKRNYNQSIDAEIEI